MTASPLVTRRMVLKDMGKAGTAIMIFGLAACSREPSSNATPTDDPLETTTRASFTPTTSQSGTTSPVSTPGSGWQRVIIGSVSAYILYRGGEAALVDTGNPNSEADIQAALAQVGLGWDSVGHVIVTHQHPDHQGSLPAVLGLSGAPWYAGQGDMDSIDASGGVAVGDGDSVFDLQIIETPGHTPGHISVLNTIDGVLVSGDALNGTDGGVAGANPRFTPDMGLANESVRKLAGFDYEVALFGHGEPVLSGASDAVTQLAETL